MRIKAVLAILAAAGIAAACGGDSVVSPSGNGRLSLMIKDSPYSDAKALLVTFSDVTAHRSGEGGFTKIPFGENGAQTRTCDLKKLVDAQDVLGVGSLSAGHYTQVRLVVSSATLYFDEISTGAPCATMIPVPGGRNASLEIPSGEVRLNREFDVEATGATTMLIDFDGDKSVTEMGNGRFRMTPVIGVVSVSN
jgi:Domain of unknown function (DUF4382)